jgi:hypothetical protein
LGGEVDDVLAVIEGPVAGSDADVEPGEVGFSFFFLPNIVSMYSPFFLLAVSPPLNLLLRLGDEKMLKLILDRDAVTIQSS